MLVDTVSGSIDVYIDVERSVAAMGSAQGSLLFNVPAMKGYEDLHRYRHVIETRMPDLIIQCGTARGGSALWFAYGSIGYHGVHVITIDVDTPEPAVFDANDVTVLTGSSTDRELFAEVEDIAARFDRVMVVLDSDHSARHVHEEIRLYSPLVSQGQYLVVEDGIYDLAGEGPFNPGPLAAIVQCMVGRDGWERDREIEAAWPISMYPAGWWRRAS